MLKRKSRFNKVNFENHCWVGRDVVNSKTKRFAEIKCKASPKLTELIIIVKKFVAERVERAKNLPFSSLTAGWCES